ncbi:MAG: hypothetical protein RJA61_735 [Candidatus Parcubacteria bacterium]|jgi:hypothetical protein
MTNSLQENDWKVLQVSIDNYPAVISFRTSINTPENIKLLPFQAGVAVPFLQPTELGLPTDTEANQLWKIEDRLKLELQTEYRALHAVTITTQRIREFVFYVAEWKPKEIEHTIKIIEKHINDSRELQFMLKEDRDWETYKNFTQ